MARLLYENGLSLVLLLTFCAFLWGQSYAGLRHYNDEQRAHRQPAISYWQYLSSGQFMQATAENWESEFLQMAAFVWLTVFLRQKGSPESKSTDGGDEPQDRQPDPTRPGAPWPVRHGGRFVLWLYSNSLSLAFALLFVVAFLAHAAGGAADHSQQQIQHGQPPVTMIQYLGTSRFWFESMQNWQSEFLVLALMVYLSVYLRQKGSPESKPVDARHDENE